MRSVEGQAPPFSWPGLHTLHWVFLENSGEWNLWTFLHQLLKRWQTEWDNDVNQVQQARYKNVKQHDATWMHFKSVEEGKIKGYVFLSVSLLWSVRVCVGVCVCESESDWGESMWTCTCEPHVPRAAKNTPEIQHVIQCCKDTQTQLCWFLLLCHKSYSVSFKSYSGLFNNSLTFLLCVCIRAQVHKYSNTGLKAADVSDIVRH